jgi:two-component system, cell cycle sensor histidine kinase and response regulator CckA
VPDPIGGATRGDEKETATDIKTGTDQRTILLVEDELQHLKLLKEIFETAGYRIIAAIDGVDATDIYRRRRDEIDLVVCDVALPKLGGWTVYLSLKEINPQVKVILTSGYLDEKVRTVFVSGGVKDFVVKPYLAETILNSVREALEKD